jgi:hypothetical protein
MSLASDGSFSDEGGADRSAASAEAAIANRQIK